MFIEPAGENVQASIDLIDERGKNGWRPEGTFQFKRFPFLASNKFKQQFCCQNFKLPPKNES